MDLPQQTIFPVFFPLSFLGTSVDFTDESKTKGIKKLNEDVFQQDEKSCLTFGSVSRSIATSLCQKKIIKRKSEAKTMKIMMQYVKFLQNSPILESVRLARLAIPNLTYTGYHTQEQNSIPAQKSESKPLEDTPIPAPGFVPGGWIIHMVIEQLRGGAIRVYRCRRTPSSTLEFACFGPGRDQGSVLNCLAVCHYLSGLLS